MDPHLDGDDATGAVVVHKDAQHVGDQLGQVKLKFATKSNHNLFNKKNDRALNRCVHDPEFLEERRQEKVRCLLNYEGTEMGTEKPKKSGGHPGRPLPSLPLL